MIGYAFRGNLVCTCVVGIFFQYGYLVSYLKISSILGILFYSTEKVLFVILRPSHQFFSQMKMSPLLVNGFFRPMLFSHDHWAVRVLYRAKLFELLSFVFSIGLLWGMYGKSQNSCNLMTFILYTTCIGNWLNII